MIATVKSWNDVRGFGFALSPSGGPDIFIHHKNMRGRGRKTLVAGQRVEFDLAETPKGLSAVNCAPLDRYPHHD